MQKSSQKAMIQFYVEIGTRVFHFIHDRHKCHLLTSFENTKTKHLNINVSVLQVVQTTFLHKATGTWFFFSPNDDFFTQSFLNISETKKIITFQNVRNLCMNAYFHQKFNFVQSVSY